MGPVPEGFYAYFRIRFPRLLLCVFEVVKEYFGDEDVFGVYFYKRPIKPEKEKGKGKEKEKDKDKEECNNENLDAVHEESGKEEAKEDV
jgi:hypothetical protein